MTIRKKLTLLYAGLLTIVVAVLSFGVFQAIRMTMTNTIDQALDDTATQIIYNSHAVPVSRIGGLDSFEVDLAPLDVFRASGVVVQVWRCGLSGDRPTFVAASANLANYTDPLDPTTLGVREATYSTVTIHNSQWRVLTRPVMVGGFLFGNVQVAASMKTVNDMTVRLVLIMGFSGLLAGIGVSALSMWFSGRALKPIEDITRAASGIAIAEDLETRLPWNGPPDELGRLISVFNHMMGRLEHLFRAQQRFVADVSHELRTPLTTIRGNLDLIKRYGMDPASLEAIEAETARMSRMVDDLLLLARADYGGLKLDLYPLDLDTVVSDVYKQARVLAQDRQLTVVMAHFEPARILGNTDRMKQLLLNLVGNAIKFTPPGGKISLSLRQQDDNAVVQVSDTGIGIDPQNLKQIFERFYQVEQSRTHKDGQEGAGLGLSIAKWITEAHSGTIRVDSELGKGSTFTVTFPLMTMAERAQPPRRRIPLLGRGRATSEDEPEEDDAAEFLDD